MSPALPLGAQSLPRLFFATASRYAGRPALGRRRGGVLASTTYAEAAEQVRNLAAGLTLLGLQPAERVALVSENWDRWLIADLAILACGAIDVPRPSDLSVQELGLTLHHAGCRFALAAGPAELESLSQIRSRLPELEVVIDLSDGADPRRATHGFSAVCEAGRRAREAGHLPPEFPSPDIGPDDLATNFYTSGTTGRPKGVMLTHGNILSNVAGLTEVIQVGPGEVMLSLLPSWHMYERTVEYAALSRGVQIVYTNLRSMREDLRDLRPTFFAGVPRIWTKLAQAAEARLAESPSTTRFLARMAWSAGVRAVAARKVLASEPDPSGEELRRPGRAAAALRWLACAPVHRTMGRMVFRPLHRALGGRLRGALCGGAALPLSLDLFFEVAGIRVLNGYGLTETSPVLTCRRFDHNIAGTVGRALPGTELRIVDQDGSEVEAGQSGRVLARGPQVMKGYYREPTLTASVLNRDGWFDTGDLGRLLPSGDLVLTGRAKDTIVLSNGENVEPEGIEERLKTSRFVDQVVVFGQDQDFLGALVVPAYSELETWARRRGLNFSQPADLIARDDVRELMRNQIAHHARRSREGTGVKRFRLLDRPFSVEDGTLTPTLKVRRAVVAERYSDEIHALFAREQRS